MESCKKEIIKSKDVFPKDQLVGDDDKIEKVSSSIEVPAIIDSIVPPTVHIDHKKSYRTMMMSLRMMTTL